MIEKYREKRFGKRSTELLDSCLVIIKKYQKLGIKLTLRQLYYQLVSGDIIPNIQPEYKRLGTLITDARYAGIVDWSAIEDRVRVPKIPSEFDGIPDLMNVALRSYRLDRWKGQEYHVELFTEKDALSSILAPKANEWHINFCVNRGYASATALYDTAQRFKWYLLSKKKEACVVLYLGDHDPSGLDMIRDIKDRLDEFIPEGRIEVDHIALTYKQIKEFNPPPNPTKTSDTRAWKYIESWGRESWEVDAMPPEALQKLIDDSIKKYLDISKMDSVIAQEDNDKETIESFAEGFIQEEE